MENRERDKMSNEKSSSTSAGDINRSTSSNIGKDKSDSSVDFGEKIGRSEEWDSEPSKRSGSMSGDSGRSSSSSSNLGDQSDVSSRRSGPSNRNEH